MTGSFPDPATPPGTPMRERRARPTRAAVAATFAHYLVLVSAGAGLAAVTLAITGWSRGESPAFDVTAGWAVPIWVGLNTAALGALAVDAAYWREMRRLVEATSIVDVLPRERRGFHVPAGLVMGLAACLVGATMALYLWRILVD